MRIYLKGQLIRGNKINLKHKPNSFNVQVFGYIYVQIFLAYCDLYINGSLNYIFKN